jgi:hypothetical protein
MGWVVNATPPHRFTPGKDPVPIVSVAGWVPGSIWTGAENLTPIGIRSPGRPARSKAPYRPTSTLYRLNAINSDDLVSSSKAQLCKSSPFQLRAILMLLLLKYSLHEQNYTHLPSADSDARNVAGNVRCSGSCSSM